MSNRPLSRTLTPGVKESFNIVFPEQVGNQSLAFSLGAVIAGGAVRDSLTGRYIKDVDVFIHKMHKMHFDTHRWTKMGRDLDDVKATAPAYTSWGNLVTTSQPITKSSGGDYGNNHVDEVFEVDDGYAMDFPVNVVFLDINPVDYVTKHFDLGICKAWYDGVYIRTHSDFINDVNSNTITCTLTAEAIKGEYGNLDRGINKISDHANRLLRKYKGFQIVMPTV